MEHPSKRRRIERRVVRSVRRLLLEDQAQFDCEGEGVSSGQSIGVPKLILPPSDLNTPGREKVQLRSLLEPLHVVKPQPTKLQLRQLLTPATNAASDAQDGVKQAVNNIAQPVTPPVENAANEVTRQGQQAVNTVTQPAQNEDGQPSVNDITQPIQDQVVQPVGNNLVEPAAATVANLPQQAADAIPNANVDVQTPPADVNADVGSPAAYSPSEAAPNPAAPDISKPVDHVPGVVAPSAAEAAETARNQALAAQQAKAGQVDPNIPSTEGPAPPPPASSSAQNDNKQGSPSNNDRLPIPGPGQSSQKPLSEPSTPLPQSPTSYPAPSSYFPPTQLSTNGPFPTGSSNPSPSPFSSPVNGNSTMSLSASMSTTASSSSISLSSASSTSQALTSSTNSFDISSMSSSTSLLMTGTEMTSAPSSSSPLPTTFLTSMSAFQASNQASSASSTALESSSAGVGGEFVGGSPTDSGPPASTSTGASSSDSGSDGGNGSPPTKALVGGIVGGCAGLILILVAILFLIRWRKGQIGRRRSISPPVPQTAGAGSAALGGAMTQRSSTRSNVPIAAAAILNRLRPASSQTATTASTGPSEKGFQKLSGRKLPSVLHSGGDGYGDNPTGQAGLSAPPARPIAPGQSPFAGLAPALRPPSPQRSLSGSSFYRDSRGFYGGVVPAESASASEGPTDPSSSPTSSSPTFPAPPSSGGLPLASSGQAPGISSSGMPNIRPGPARQPVIQQGGVVPMRTPSRPQPPRPRPAPSPIAENPRDPLGRSHPSQDGSRQSRFRESTTPP